MEDKPNYYAVIPSNVRYDNELVPNEKLMYGEITALTNKQGECWATNKYFSELYKVHINTVSNWIQHLKNKGYISTEIIYKEDKKTIEKRIIKISGEPIKKNVKTYQQKQREGINKNIERGINKNVEENNTRYNNTRLINNINSNSSNNNIYIIELFEKNIHSITPIEYEKLISWEKIFNDDVIAKAIEISVLNNARSLSYIQTILRDWKNKGFRTLSDIENSEKNRNKTNKEESHVFTKEELEGNYE